MADPKVLDLEAFDLAESWINGNRSDVIAELTDHCDRDDRSVAYLAIGVYRLLPESDRESLRSKLRGKL